MSDYTREEEEYYRQLEDYEKANKLSSRYGGSVGVYENGTDALKRVLRELDEYENKQLNAEYYGGLDLDAECMRKAEALAADLYMDIHPNETGRDALNRLLKHKSEIKAMRDDQELHGLAQTRIDHDDYCRKEGQRLANLWLLDIEPNGSGKDYLNTINEVIKLKKASADTDKENMKIVKDLCIYYGFEMPPYDFLGTKNLEHIELLLEQCKKDLQEAKSIASTYGGYVPDDYYNASNGIIYFGAAINGTTELARVKAEKELYGTASAEERQLIVGKAAKEREKYEALYDELRGYEAFVLERKLQKEMSEKK